MSILLVLNFIIGGGKMIETKTQKNESKLKSFVRSISTSVSVLILWGIPLLLTAGTINYWNAWLFVLTISISWIVINFYLVKNDPVLFEKRQRKTEKKLSQQMILFLCTVFLISAIILSGLDYRFHWSRIPFSLSILFTLVMIVGFVMLFFVLKQNSYASRKIEIQEGQQIIDTGLYSLVRHPMYLSLIIAFIFTPIILGSWYAFIPIIFIPILLTFRINYEEKELRKGLEGYDLYMKKVKYKLVPCIW
jgi:protein-S-isoprenylcysteine O-methyltransferase Ste14